MSRHRGTLLTLVVCWRLFGCCGASQDSLVPGPGVSPLPGGGTETGNPGTGGSGGGQVIFLSYSSSELAQSAPALRTRRSSSQIRALTLPEMGGRVTEALFVVREINMEEDEGCHELSFAREATIIDLLDIVGADNPSGSHEDTSQGECHPKFLVTFGPLVASDRMAETDLGQRMLGKTFLIRIEGIRDQPIEFRGDKTWTTSLHAPEEWIDPAAGENLICGFDRDLWFGGIDLLDSQYPVLQEGGETLIVVDSAQFPEVLDLLVENEQNSIALFPDKDGNRQLELEEFQAPITSPIKFP